MHHSFVLVFCHYSNQEADAHRVLWLYYNIECAFQAMLSKAFGLLKEMVTLSLRNSGNVSIQAVDRNRETLVRQDRIDVCPWLQSPCKDRGQHLLSQQPFHRIVFYATHCCMSLIYFKT